MSGGERTAGGLAGKVAGKLKAAAGAITGNTPLEREGRLQDAQAEAELEASTKLGEASKIITQNPLGLELRRMQMISEVGAEQNTTTIIMMPSEFVTLAQGLSRHFGPPVARTPAPVEQPNGVGVG